MKLFNRLSHATTDEDLVQETERLLETVQNYVEDGLDLDLSILFDAGERGMTLCSYNTLIDLINAQINIQNGVFAKLH